MLWSVDQVLGGEGWASAVSAVDMAVTRERFQEHRSRARRALHLVPPDNRPRMTPIEAVTAVAPVEAISLISREPAVAFALQTLKAALYDLSTTCHPIRQGAVVGDSSTAAPMNVQVGMRAHARKSAGSSSPVSGCATACLHICASHSSAALAGSGRPRCRAA